MIRASELEVVRGLTVTYIHRMATTEEALSLSASPSAANGTTEEEISTAVLVFRTLFIIFDSVFTIVGNPFCIVVIRRTQTLSDSAKVFMIALAVADLAVGVTAAFSVVPAAIGDWFWGNLLCKATSALVTIFCLASVSFLVCLSVDRMIAVTRSLHYPAIMTQRRALIISVGVWVGSVVIIGGSWVFSPPVDYSNFSVTCAWHWDDNYVAFASVVSTCFFILPSSVLYIMYLIMFKISRKHARRIANQAPAIPAAREADARPRPRALSVPHWLQANAAANPRHQGDRKALKMFCVITLAFTIAWLPYSVSILYISIRSVPFPHWVGFLVTWLALSNSWFNVIIYVCMNGALRETALRILKKQRWCFRLPPRCCPIKSREVVQAPAQDQQAFNTLAT
ncbi:alpha-1A adrenergic receptor-like [Patiria miniata]|uniref:G-protein coupled receptors family 1 profile domain-containing protein n=1 Tax=Patiria miniata TaxID=46514 RepID=A0A914BMG4_PATMI|nr:alpha-1A adrenergic receptor-like [Patiria miniata]